MKIEPNQIQELLEALSNALSCRSEIAQILQALAWPTVVGLGLVGFRRSLTQLLTTVGGRMRRISAFNVEVELADAISTPNLSTFEFDGQNVAGETSSSSTMALFAQIASGTSASSLIVDIGGGKSWLLSRVFLFSFVLQRTRTIGSVVFVRTTEGRPGQFLGLATPDMICAGIARKHPEFAASLAQAISDAVANCADWIPGAALDIRIATQVVGNFLMKIQSWAAPTISVEEWELLTTRDGLVWEHAKWIDQAEFDREIAPLLFDRDESRLVVTPDTSKDDRNQSLLRRQAPFIALVNERNEVKNIVDRSAFLNRLAAHIAK